MPTESPARILRLKAVLERTGLSRSALYRKMQERTFPKVLRISARCTGWRETDIDAGCEVPKLTRSCDWRAIHSASASTDLISMNVELILTV